MTVFLMTTVKKRGNWYKKTENRLAFVKKDKYRFFFFLFLDQSQEIDHKDGQGVRKT